jgi:putative addiction module component (TIGR02574 family)
MVILLHARSLVEKLLASLDQPDKTIDELWAKEAENRIDAYEAGNIKAVSAEQVFGKSHEKQTIVGANLFAL